VLWTYSCLIPFLPGCWGDRLVATAFFSQLLMNYVRKYFAALIWTDFWRKAFVPGNLLLQQFSFEVILLVLSTHCCMPVLYQNAFERRNWFQLDYVRDTMVDRSGCRFARHEGLWWNGIVHNPFLIWALVGGEWLASPPGHFRADSHIPCRSPAVPLPF
jgi:hypothetical protein